ncbi:MAG TPA: sugar phosphate nucleotidyltransferase [Pyrinomonadaceae bacterium]|nr:sugar phosphate nucleotidyltransferase [Pyrinomonadaceae bacterium]
MKTVILCGGRGTRLSEHGNALPKALVRIGDEPIIVHLMRLYAHYGLMDFVLCLGFLSDQIREYFVTNSNEWNVEAVETGLDTNTGGRIKLIEKHLGDDKEFCVTYGDGLANIDIAELLNFHRSHGKIATLTAVHPVSSFGLVNIAENGAVTHFEEKPVLKDWINGGFFVFDRKIFEYLDSDSVLEREPLERLANENELMAFRHHGFWKCMDTYKDQLEFNELWSADPVWKVW